MQTSPSRLSMRSLRASILFLFLIAGLYPASARTRRSGLVKPVWKTDLRGLGLNTNALRWSLSTHGREQEAIRRSIVFARRGHIAVAFLTQQVARKNGRFQDVLASRRLHLISLDAGTGSVLASRTWPVSFSNSADSSVAATADGKFLVLNPGRLSMYTAGLREIGKFYLPSRDKGDWSMLVTPAGNLVFLLRSRFSGPNMINLDRRSFARLVQSDAFRHAITTWSLQMLSLPDFRVIHFWKDSGQIVSVSANYLAKLGEGATLDVRGLNSGWRALNVQSACPGTPRWPEAEFVSENSLLVVPCANVVEITTVNGKTVFSERLPQGHPITAAWASVGGRFVAVAVSRASGIRMAVSNTLLTPLDMQTGPLPWRILIYDTNKGQLVDALRSGWGVECAFSPDSSRVAVFRGEFVEMFKLPR